MDFGAGLRAILALAVTLGLLGMLAYLAMRFDLMSLFNNDPQRANKKWSEFFTRSAIAQRRLHIIEQRPIDARNRLMVVRWDDVEHLILVGGDGGGLIASKNVQPPAEGGAA